jgi:hypothetical protein
VFIKGRKFLTCFVFAFVLILSVSSIASAAESITTYVNTKKINFTTSPILEKGRTLVEFRPIFEALGLSVEYYSASKTIVGKNNDVKIQLTLGSKTAYVNGSKVALEVAPKTIKGRTLVPIRFISDSTGSEILWHGSVNEIDIYSKSFNGTKRTPSKSLKAARGTKWNMNVNEVMKIETADLLWSGREGSIAALGYYPVEKYNYDTELTYFFENDSLSLIAFDFYAGQEYYHTWSEMVYIHDYLHRLASKEHGEGSFVSDGYSNLSTLWDLGSSYLLLNVNDENVYTSANLIFYPKGNYSMISASQNDKDTESPIETVKSLKKYKKEIDTLLERQ